MKLIKLLPIAIILTTATGCTAAARQAFEDSLHESSFARTPFKSSYMHRLRAEDYCESKATSQGIYDVRAKVAYKLDCLHSLDWI